MQILICLTNSHFQRTFRTNNPVNGFPEPVRYRAFPALLLAHLAADKLPALVMGLRDIFSEWHGQVSAPIGSLSLF